MKQLEVMIQAEVQADDRTRRQYELITTVPGVGPVLATTLLAATDAFTRYAAPRQLACHAGTAPFEIRDCAREKLKGVLVNARGVDEDEVRMIARLVTDPEAEAE